MAQQPKVTNEELLNIIINYIQNKGYSPTIRELCELSGISSTNTMYFRLRKLRDNGLITMVEYEPRTIAVVGFKYVKESEI